MLKVLKTVMPINGYGDIAQEFEAKLNAQLALTGDLSLYSADFTANNNSIFANIFYGSAMPDHGAAITAKVFQYDVRGFNQNLAHLMERDINAYFSDNAMEEANLKRLSILVSDSVAFVVIFRV
jgi:hypothetical protein